MSRYLRNLVTRNLEKTSGLSPRPATRYESVRRNTVVECIESARERPFQDLPPWTAPIETDIPRVESFVERDGRTDTNLPSESRRELIGQGRQDQSGIVGETSGEGETVKKTRADLSQPFREISREEAATLAPVSRRKTAGSDRRETNSSHAMKRSEFLAAHPGTVKNSAPSVRPRDVLNDSLPPALNGGSFQPVRGVLPPESRAPVVRIRIGRIEVRAVEPPVPTQGKKPVESPRSSVSLGQYLRRRSQEA